MSVVTNPNDFLWTERFRPKTVADCILPDSIKKTFQDFVDNKNIPNLLLHGGPGCGKTTLARAMLEELGCDYIEINGSLNMNIDALRTTVTQFASCVSFSGGRKFIILDEADGIGHIVQPALKGFMESFASNCGFILTANLPNKIIEPLRSRCSVIDFRISKTESQKLATKFLKRVCSILEEENVTFQKDVVAQVIMKFYPDWRRVLNELQRYSSSGTIDSGMLADINGESFKTLVKYLKEKKFTETRKWVAEHGEGDSVALFRKFYDTASDLMKPDSIPQLVIHLAAGLDSASRVADQEINMTATLLNIMIDCEWL